MKIMPFHYSGRVFKQRVETKHCLVIQTFFKKMPDILFIMLVDIITLKDFLKHHDCVEVFFEI